MTSQVQELSSQVLGLSSQLGEIQLEKLHEMELSQASVEGNRLLLKKMKSIGHFLFLCFHLFKLPRCYIVTFSKTIAKFSFKAEN
jgi:hypothetical protein